MELRSFLSFASFELKEKQKFAVRIIGEIINLARQSTTRRLQLLCILRYLRKLDSFALCFNELFDSFDSELSRLVKHPALFLGDDENLDIFYPCREVVTAELDIFLTKIEKVHNANPDKYELFHRLLCQLHPSWPQLIELSKNTYKHQAEITCFLAQNLVIHQGWHSTEEKDAIFILSEMWQMKSFSSANFESFLNRCANLGPFSPLITRKLSDLRQEFAFPPRPFPFPVRYDYLHVPKSVNATFVSELVDSTDILFSSDDKLRDVVIEDALHFLQDHPKQFENEAVLIAAILLAADLCEDKRKWLPLVNIRKSYDLEVLCHTASTKQACRELLYRKDIRHSQRGLAMAFTVLCYSH